MITFEKALDSVLARAKRLGPEMTPLHRAVGCVLAEDVKAGLDMPPFNKSAMDGYALRSTDVKTVPVELKVEGMILPGGAFKKTIQKGRCARIMTGAALPRGADCVVMVENTEKPQEQGYVTILNSPRKWENVCFKGEDIRKGSVVLRKGTLLRPPEIAIAASVGKSKVKIYRRPKAAILNTGDEIVEPGSRRAPEKIYNSNGPMLFSHLSSMNIDVEYLGIARDEEKILKAKIRKALGKDIAILSGGVSMGNYDLVPKALKECGVKEIFHNVRQKPGKPLFFGTKKGKLIFGVPGNPVSTFFVFCTFIKPAIEKMMGNKAKLDIRRGVLETDFKQRPGKKHFVPARVYEENGALRVEPVPSYHGSADIASVTRANAFMIVEGDVSLVKKNSAVEVLLW